MTSHDGDTLYLDQLAPGARLSGSVLRGSVVGSHTIVRLLNAVRSFHRYRTTVYIEEAGRRTFSETEAVLDTGTPMRDIVVLERDDDGLVVHISIRSEPLDAVLSLAARLAPLLAPDLPRDVFL